MASLSIRKTMEDKELGPTRKICDILVYKNQCLGSGAFGSVFMGQLNGEFCAVKVLHPLGRDIQVSLAVSNRGVQEESLKRFKRECDYLEKFEHSNVVRHIASRVHPESKLPVLVLELLDCSLTDYLKQSTTDLPLKTQVSLSCEIASALAYLHDPLRNIVHRDLCSDNILLKIKQSGNEESVPLPVAKVGDFGMSRIIDSTNLTHTLSAMGHRAGYVPSEAFTAEYDSSIDVFMFGVIMIQIVRKIHHIGSEKERVEYFQSISKEHLLYQNITNCLEEKGRRPRAEFLHQSLCLLNDDECGSLQESILCTCDFSSNESLSIDLDERLNSQSANIDPIQPQSSGHGPTHAAGMNKSRPHTLPTAAPSQNQTTAQQGQRRDSNENSSVNQIFVLSSTFKLWGKKIGVLYFSEADKLVARTIVKRLSVLLGGGASMVQAMDMTKDSSHWFREARDAVVDYYVFIGLPPLSNLKGSSPSPEEKFFDPTRESQRVGQVVVVTTKNTPLSPGGRAMDDHYLSKFLHLDSKYLETTAENALALFAGTSPIPYDTDRAYWSANPKLVVVRKGGQKSLGLSIMTREISPKSQFPRISVVQSFNQDCIQGIQEKLGKYTHIQSINGVFLDGMNISDVTKIFQTSKAMEAQLIVRYIHPLKDGDRPPMTPYPVTPAALKPPAPRCSLTTEVLPIPVFILGDIHSLCSELFKWLSRDAESPYSETSQGSSSDEGSDVATPLPNVWRDINGKKMNRHVVKTDEEFERAVIPFSLFRNLPTLPQTPSSSVGPPMFLPRLDSTLPDTAAKHFILHLQQKELDRHFAHIYLRSSGIYLIATSLEEMMDDPLIQFENLCFWLRLVETYVTPNEVKRIIIVGMYEAKTNAQIAKVQACVDLLNDALREADFKQIMVHSRSDYVFRFNTIDPMGSRNQLCATINKCLEVINNRTWYYEREFFESSMRPFAGFGNVLTYLSDMKKVVASADEICGLCSFSDANYFKTLEAYSGACISTTGKASLLKPLFLEKLIKSMIINTSQEYMLFAVLFKQVKRLPVVTAPWPKKQMDILVGNSGRYQLDNFEQDEVLRWAEKLEVMFNIGVKDGEVHYFVPFLSEGESASYFWDDDEGESFQTESAIVLYACLHFPATHNFFCSLIAELLRAFLKDAKRGTKCFINFGCTEAILPMKCTKQQQSQEHSVYLKYHPLQNIIEFRTKAALQQMTLYNDAKSLLTTALSQSKYKFDEMVTFSIPSQVSNPQLALWKLAATEDDQDAGETEILKTTQLTPELMKIWASSNPGMKREKISYAILDEWGKKLGAHPDKWALVGGRLGLMDVTAINHFRQYPYKNGNGELVLIKWLESHLPHTDLIEALRSPQVAMHDLASRVEKLYSVKHNSMKSVMV